MRPRADDGNTYRYHATGHPAGGDFKPPWRVPTSEDYARRRRNRRLWFWGTCLIALYAAYCCLVLK
jgi:hypothetical protein